MNVIKFANANNKALLAGYQDTGLLLFFFLKETLTPFIKNYKISLKLFEQPGPVFEVRFRNPGLVPFFFFFFSINFI